MQQISEALKIQQEKIQTRGTDCASTIGGTLMFSSSILGAVGAGLQASAFAVSLAAKINGQYTGVYKPSRLQAIRMAYAKFPAGQKLYSVEIDQMADILGRIPGETIQNWSLLIRQVLGGSIVPLPMCTANEVVDPISRKCRTKQVILPEQVILPDPYTPPSEKKESKTSGLVWLGLAAVGFMLISGGRQ